MGGPQSLSQESRGPETEHVSMLPTKTCDIAFYNGLGCQTLNIYGIRLGAFNKQTKVMISFVITEQN